jgi:hypothetical protein
MAQPFGDCAAWCAAERVVNGAAAVRKAQIAVVSLSSAAPDDRSAVHACVCADIAVSAARALRSLCAMRLDAARWASRERCASVQAIGRRTS